MTTKTMGQFLAALRKANGLTQKQVAERLHVSDKAVSRWERDECAPDLSLIPALAELFDVTADELLRGERLSPRDRQNAGNGRGEKQLKYLLQDTNTKFSIRSTVAVGVGLLGLVAALFGNFGFNRAYIGFFCGCVCFLAAVICEISFVHLAYMSIPEEEFAGDCLHACKRRLFHGAYLTFSAIVVLFAMTLPLAYLPIDTYMGITFAGWVPGGLLCGGVGALLCWFLLLPIRLLASRNGLYPVIDKSDATLSRLRRRFVMIGVVVLAVTFGGQAIFNSICSPRLFSKAVIFTDLQAFKVYIETSTDIGTMDGMAIGAIDEEEDAEWTDYIYNEKGDVVLEYTHRNMAVTQLFYDWQEDGVTVTTYTAAALAKGDRWMNAINITFLVVYIAEALAVVWLYRKRKVI